MTVVYPNLFYKKVCYKGTALCGDFLSFWQVSSALGIGYLPPWHPYTVHMSVYMGLSQDLSGVCDQVTLKLTNSAINLDWILHEASKSFPAEPGFILL